ncbi:MAG: hypothetical protein MRZ86_01195 [Acidaminococcus sp.]|nr:hypothetical protein [Acidaminococcus sp.]MDY4560045.1 hypothetical protein [Eubacteriales bacterium]
MSKKVDFVAIFCITYMLLFVVFKNYLLKPLPSLFVAGVCAVTVIVTIYAITNNKRPYSYDRLLKEFIKKPHLAINLVSACLKNPTLIRGENYVASENAIIFFMYKLSPLSPQDVLGIINVSKSLKINKVYVATKAIDRRSYALIDDEKISLSVLPISSVFKFLKKENALPDLKKAKMHFSLMGLIATFLDRQNMRFYLFSGTILISLSFITPLTGYYIFCGSMSYLMAILCLSPLGKGNFKKEKIFESFKGNQISIDECLSKQTDSQT